MRLAAGTPPPFEARLIRRAGTDYIVRGESKSGSIQAQVERGRIRVASEADAVALRSELEKQQFVVASTATKETRRNPQPPFVTARLQQDASRKLGFTAKRTMALAQKLYEGVEIGEEGTTGLITYMRTDSTRVSDTALGEVRGFIGGNFGGAGLNPIFDPIFLVDDARHVIRKFVPRDILSSNQNLDIADLFSNFVVCLLQVFDGVPKHLEAIAANAAGDNEKSVSFRLTVGAPDRTLSSDEVGVIRGRIIEGMREKGYDLRV